jgi:hypothetical protein
MHTIFGRARCAAVLIAAVPTLTIAQVEHRALSGDRVSIYNLAGHLEVRAGAGSQVTIDVTRAGHDAAQLKLASGDVRGWQALRVLYPSDKIVYPALGRRSRTSVRVNADGTFDDDGDGRRGDGRVEIRDSGSGTEAHADMVVSVPKGQRLAVHWGVGDADITNVDGDLRVSVAAARVTSSHTRGRLNLDTGSGSVSVTDAQGDVALDTGSGGVTLKGVRGENLDVDTGSGSVRGEDVDVRTLKIDVGSGGLRFDRVKASRTSVDAGSGSTEMAFLSTVDDLAVDAGSGGVTIHLPGAQGGEIDVDTGSGGIDTDFTVQTTHIERNHIRGRIGAGNARIKIESGSGHVRLLKN